MSTSTFTPSDQKQDDDLNPGQQDYNRRFEDIAKAEEEAEFNNIVNNYNSPADPSTPPVAEDSVAGQEANPAQNKKWDNTPKDNWANNVSPSNNKPNVNNDKGWFKKTSPLIGTGGVIGVAIFIIMGLSSPALLIVHMKEMITDKFSGQVSTAQIRSNMVLNSKISDTTKGFCTNSIAIRCKYASMSDRQIKKITGSGGDIKITTAESRVPGRSHITSLTFKGQVIEPRQFPSFVANNPDFRNALKKAYNPSVNVFLGNAWKKVGALYNISRTKPELDAKNGTDEAQRRLNAIASEGVQDLDGPTQTTPDETDCDGQPCRSQQEADEINNKASDIETNKSNASLDVREKLSSISTSKSVVNFFKASAPIEYACQGYGALTALSYAGKAIRTVQLVRYAMVFLTIADAIKAGESPDPEDVAFLGAILIATVKSPTNPNKTVVHSATDSFGYKYAAYNDVSAPASSMLLANRFTAGGGFIGEMSEVTSNIMAPFNNDRGKARTVCKTLANPVVQTGSIIVGVAMLFVPGVNAGAALAKGAAAGALSIGISLLPSLLADIVAGTVTEGILGEESGNAIISGSGALLSDTLAGHNGNAPLSKADAIAFNELQTETMNQTIADELREKSPFDPTSPHTFVGSIVANLLPLQSSSNPLTGVASLLQTSMASIVPTSKAADATRFQKSLDICQDLDVLESGYAADPFCNVIRGIPTQYIFKDPIKVVDELYFAGHIDEEGRVKSEIYKNFIAECMENKEPLGYKDAQSGFDPDQAKGCYAVTDERANFYLFHMDQQIDAGLNGDYEGTEEVAAVAGDSGADLPDGSAAELAQMILSSGNVVDRTGQLNQIINGSRTNVSADILKVTAALAQSNKFAISSLRRDQVLSKGAGAASYHLKGSAIDISGSYGVNGVSYGFNGHNPTVQAFLLQAAAALPPNCSIGVPNQAYVNATKPHVKAGCRVFVDNGKDVKPHIHLDIREDS